MALADIAIPLVTFGGGVIGSWLLKPKALAEARKASAEADTLDWNRFQAEISRLDAKISLLEVDRDARALVFIKREAENKTLRATVKRLEKRIADLENIFKLHPVPPEMQAELDKLR